MRLVGDRVLFQTLSSRWRHPTLIQTAISCYFHLVANYKGSFSLFRPIPIFLTTSGGAKETPEVILWLGIYLHFLEFPDGVCQCRWVSSSHCNTQKAWYYEGAKNPRIRLRIRKARTCVGLEKWRCLLQCPRRRPHPGLRRRRPRGSGRRASPTLRPRSVCVPVLMGRGGGARTAVTTRLTDTTPSALVTSSADACTSNRYAEPLPATHIFTHIYPSWNT